MSAYCQRVLRDWRDPELGALLDRLVADDPRRLLELSEGEFAAVFSEAVSEATKTAAPRVRDSLRKDAADMRERRRAGRAEFEQMLRFIWREALEELEALIEAARDSGDMFHERVGQYGAADEDVVYDVLLRFHARACRMAEEALVLVQAGFGQAAMTRWRSLHELTVCGMFISRHGEAAAEPYLRHEAVASLEAMREHDELLLTGRLEGRPFDAADRDRLEAEVASLRQRYGKAFTKTYGWAAPALQLKRGTSFEPSFKDIEKDVELDHLRPWYRMANHAVHGAPKGITWTPDLFSPLQSDGVLLAGPGFNGLADPIQCVAMSLVQATINVLLLSPGVNDILVMRTLLLMSDDVAGAAVMCSDRLDGGELVDDGHGAVQRDET
jgi:hypothetical protein